MNDETSPWDCPGFDLPPVAGHVGPFPHRSFVETLWRHRLDEARSWPVGDEQALVPLVRTDAEVRFPGDADLVDYRSPLGSPSAVSDVLGSALSELETGTGISFDSLPEEAAAPLVKALAEAGVGADPERHAVTAVLHLPRHPDDWMQGIGKKERHELRRKTRRFETALGEARLERHTSPGPALEAFLAMHRRAGGAKGGFMTPPMAMLFRDLLGQDGWHVDLLCAEPGPVAAVFAYQDAAGYYLYNSAYDPDQRDVSPGVVLLGLLIDRSIRSGLEVFDFLKGDEAYKFRLGAEPRPLYSVAGAK